MIQPEYMQAIGNIVNYFGSKYPERVPVIILQKDDGSLPKLTIVKYLVPKQSQLSNLLLEIKKNLDISADRPIYMHINGQKPLISATISDLHEEFKDSDGILKIHISSDNSYINRYYHKLIATSKGAFNDVATTIGNGLSATSNTISNSLGMATTAVNSVLYYPSRLVASYNNPNQ